MTRQSAGKVLALHLGVLALLFAAQFVLPAYHHTNLARIMVLATYAVGYNVLLGYTGLMSLGHAMFFAAGMYGAGLPIYYLQFGALQGFCIGVLLSLTASISALPRNFALACHEIAISNSSAMLMVRVCFMNPSKRCTNSVVQRSRSTCSLTWKSHACSMAGRGWRNATRQFASSLIPARTRCFQ